MDGANTQALAVFVDGTLDASPDAPWTAADRAVSGAMMGYWTQFAAAGDPNRDGLPAWPAYTPDGDIHLTFAETMETGAGFSREGAALFDRFEARRRADGELNARESRAPREAPGRRKGGGADV